MRERRLTAGIAHHRSPTWSRDAKWLAFAVGEGSASSWLVTDRRGRVAMALEGPVERGAAFGPDGALAYGRRAGATSEIWLTPGGGVPGVRLLGGDGRLYCQPAFSPDGDRLVCASDASGAGRTQLLALDLKSGARTVLTDGTRSDGHPSFSPDGTALFFQSQAGTDSAIFLLDLSAPDATPERLTSTDHAFGHPTALTNRLAIAERSDGAPDARAELVLIERDAAHDASHDGRSLATSGIDVRQPAVHVSGLRDAAEPRKVRLAYTALLPALPGQPRRYDILVARLGSLGEA